MSDIPTIKRQLKIKAGVVKRLTKEHNLYIKEAEEQQRKLDKFVADGGDHWDVGNATRVLDEGKKMIVDSNTRLGKAVGELRDLLVSARKEPEITQDEDFLKAEEALEEAST